MTSDAQALVRQLTENPEVLESMHHMLSLLRANQAMGGVTAATHHGSSSASASAEQQHQPNRVRPPRTGYEDGGRPPSNQHSNRQSGAPDTYNMQEVYPHSLAGESSGTSSPLPSFASSSGAAAAAAAAATAGGRTASASSRAPPRRSTNVNPPHTGVPFDAVAAAAESEELLHTTKKLSEAQRRIADLESELQRTTLRVDQLSSLVHKQKEDLQEAQERHTLEIEETRHAYDAVVRRKDEVQEEALRQIMRSRQLMVSAAKYEAVVNAQRREKENNNSSSGTGSTAQRAPADSYGHAAGASGLSVNDASVNLRHTPSHHLSGSSAMKRERAEDEGGDGAKGYTTYYTNSPKAEPYTQQQQQLPHKAAKRTASDSWGTPTSLGRARQAVLAHAKAESPDFITSPTPAGKQSTTLVGGGRTQSRSTRKRRTPRTPSLTNADRLAAASSFPRLQPQQQLPSPRVLQSTPSLKLDSPTPVVSTTWTAGRSLTSSRTPPPPPVGPTSLSSTSTKARGPTDGITQHNAQQHRQQMQAASTKPPPLLPRTAGRLPPPTSAGPASLAKSTAIGSGTARSATSSVAADGPTRSPSPVNPKRGNAGPRRFVFTGLKEEELQRLAAAIATVGDDAAALVSELDEVPPTPTTHIVLRGTPRSVKALCGVVSGKWLVSPEYIMNSLESGFWLDELEEGGMRIAPPPLRAQRFLVTVEHDGIRQKLAQVIEYGGGEVLPRKYGGQVAQDVVVITSGDDLLRYATEGHM